MLIVCVCILELESLLLKDSVATDLRAAGRSEMKREPLVVHIPWLEDCDVFHELMYGM